VALPPDQSSRSYLDHASSSPLRPEARAALVEWLDTTGDPGRVHAEGLTTRVVVEQAREQVASLVGARPREVVFTSGGTEAIAAACWGAAGRGHHQVVPAVEHSAVRLAASRHGEVTIVAVDGQGRVALDDLLAAVRGDTALVHLQWGNHEVGTTQPVAEAVAACRARGVLVHVDAAQAVGHVRVGFRELGADLLSVSAHKLGGPPGVGALLVRQGLRLPPLLVGGDQERARRAGLENVPALAGFGAACAALAAAGQVEAEGAEQRRLTQRILDALGTTAGLAGLRAYGDPDERLPHIVCLGVEDIEPQAVLMGLDRAGIAAHSGSACSSESLEPSPVLEAMGVDAHHSLRLSVGWSTTGADVDRLVDALPRVLADLRALAV
jgi:cysteine desulfurase